MIKLEFIVVGHLALCAQFRNASKLCASKYSVLSTSLWKYRNNNFAGKGFEISPKFACMLLCVYLCLLYQKHRCWFFFLINRSINCYKNTSLLHKKRFPKCTITTGCTPESVHVSVAVPSSYRSSELLKTCTLDTISVFLESFSRSWGKTRFNRFYISSQKKKSILYERRVLQDFKLAKKSEFSFSALQIMRQFPNSRFPNTKDFFKVNYVKMGMW